MFAFSRAKVHFFFEICKRKMIFFHKIPLFLAYFRHPRRKKKEKEKDAAGAAWRPVRQG